MGAGQIGLLATLILRLRGLEVFTVARRPAPRLPAEIVAGLGAEYVSTEQTSIEDLAARVGKADLIMEATGNSSIAFTSMGVLGYNGVLVWHSVTAGNASIEVPSDKLNMEFVAGNKLLLGSVNANREHFEMGIQDLALGEAMYPGVIEKILTSPVDGLENYQEMIRLLVEDRDALKVYVNVAAE